MTLPPDPLAAFLALLLDPPVLAALALVLAALMLLWVLVLTRRLHRTEARAQRESRTAARLWGVLAVAGDAHYIWHLPDGDETCSRQLAVLLSLPDGTDSRFAHLREAVSEDDRGRMERVVTALRHEGVGFEINLSLAPAGRRVVMHGVRATDDDGVPLADVLWVRDVTDAAMALEEMTARLQAEDDQNLGYAALLDALPYPAWLRNEQGVLVYCNAAYAAAVEAADPEEATRHNWCLGGPPESGMDSLTRRVLDSGRAMEDRRHLVVAGERRLYRMLESPVLGRRRIAGAVVDLSPLERVRSELRRQGEAHSEILEHLNTAIAIFGSDRVMEFHNSAFARLWRLDKDWLATHPTYSEFLESLRDDRLLPETADYPLYKADELKRFATLLAPVEDLMHLPDGTTLRRTITPHPFGGLVFTYEDVTDKLALERSHNTMLTVQRETIDHLYEGVALIGADGQLKLANQAFGTLWSLPADVLDGATRLAELLDRHRECMTAEKWRTFRDEIMTLFGERLAQSGRIEREDDSVVQFASVPLSDGALLLTYQDVTDTVRVEQALRDRNEALATANRMKSEFLSAVGHELRTPLTTVLGFGEMLAGGHLGPLPPAAETAVTAVVQGGHTLERVLQEVLDLATVEAGRVTPAPQPVTLGPLLAAAVLLVRERIRQQGVTLMLDGPPLDAEAALDPEMMKQVLYHLLDNAVTYTPAGGRVTLGARREPGRVVLTVADTGPGLPPSVREALFLPFHHGPGPDSGAGLGLALAQRLMIAQGGRLSLERSDGSGTVLSCTVPQFDDGG